MGNPYDSALGLSEAPAASPTAPAPLRNNNPGALMPGGKLASYSSPAEGLAALDANLANYGRQGVNTLAGVVSKWAPAAENDTGAYVADVSRRLGLDPNRPIDLSNPTVRHAIATGLMLHENGPDAVFGGKAATTGPKGVQPATSTAANDPYDAALLGPASPGPAAAPAPVAIGSNPPPMPKGAWPTDQAAVKPGADPYSDWVYAHTGSGWYQRPGESWWQAEQRNESYDRVMREAGSRRPASAIDAVRNAVGAFSGAVAGGYNGLISLVRGGSSNDAANAVTRVQQATDYTPANPESRALIGGLNSGANPLNWPAMAGEWIGGKLADAGYPATGATIAGLGAVAPMVAGMPSVRGAVGRGAVTLRDMVSPPTPAPRVEPTMTPLSLDADTRAGVGAILDSVKGQPRDVVMNTLDALDKAHPEVQSVTATVRQQALDQGTMQGNLRNQSTIDSALENGRRAVVGDTSPTRPKVSAAPGGAGGIGDPASIEPPKSAMQPKPQTFSDPAHNVFAEQADDVKGGVSPADQDRRVAILQQIGIDNARKASITGDSMQGSTDYQMSRVDAPSGAVMRAQLDQERAALNRFADKITQDTGGTPLNDQGAKYARGGTIIQALDGLKDWFDEKTSQLYQVADERARGVPTELDKFRTVLGDDSLATNSDRVQLRQAIQAYARKLNIIHDDGSVFSDGQQAESLRKYLGENWSPQSAGLIAKLKDALDDDITAAAGEDVYGQARAMRTLRGQTIDNPKGIAQLMDASGPNGINRRVPREKIADAVTTMPVDQLAHVINTLKNMPEELQPQAQAALAEIRAQFASNVHDMGGATATQWNAKGVTKYLAANSRRMQLVFSPDEMQRFGTLNDAGNILAKDVSYPGAAVQQHNLARAGVNFAVSKGAAAGGALVGSAFGPGGTVVGTAVGNAIGDATVARMNAAASMRAAQQRIVPLSSLVKKKPLAPQQPKQP